MIQRRGFLAGFGALLFAPAIIRTPGLLMPVKTVALGHYLTLSEIVTEALRSSEAFRDVIAKNNALLVRLSERYEMHGGILRVRLPLDLAVNQNPVDTRGQLAP